MPLRDVIAAVNKQRPTGIDSQWGETDVRSFTSDGASAFHDGPPNPSPCDRDPDRMHYILEC
jgi:hypothetical protein